MHSRWWLLAVAALGLGCITPRSMTVGQMAAPVGPGATEVGVFAGVLYVSETKPPYTTQDIAGGQVTNQERHTAFALPGAEANLQYGFTEHVGLNVHASPAGIQPGVKWTLNRSRVAHVALLPALAFGYASTGSSTFAAGADGVQHENNPGSTTSFTFLGGLKILVSHRGGFFAGVGYDFTVNRSRAMGVLGTGNVQDKTNTLTITTGHQLSASVGFDIKLGMVHLRPEVAFAANPGIASSITTRVGAVEESRSAGGGFGFAIFPGFSLAVESPARQRADDDEDEAPRRRRSSSDDDDDDDDDDDEQPRPRNRYRRGD